MVTVKRILFAIGVVICCGAFNTADATVYEHMTLVMNGQVSDMHVTVVPGNGETLEAESSSVQKAHVPPTPIRPANALPSATPNEDEFFLSPNRIALLAFGLAGFLAARKQSQL